MKIYNTNIEQAIEKLGFSIVDVGLGGRPVHFYKNMNWWNMYYGNKTFSVFFDKNDIMSSVGEPYYEIYNGNDIERFLLNDGNKHEHAGFKLVRHLRSTMEGFKLDQQNNPENWL